MMTISPSRMDSNTRLAPEEILEIVQEINTKYSPIISAQSFGVAKKIALTFTSKQLMEISAEITRKYTPKLNSDNPKVVLLPIDPDHLYASWNLGNSKVASALNDGTREQEIVLRIYPAEDKNTNVELTKDWFDIAIKPDQTRQKVNLSTPNKASSYVATIGKRTQDDKFTVMAASEVAHRPRAKDANLLNADSGTFTNSMIQTLSSIGQISLQNPYNASGSGAK